MHPAQIVSHIDVRQIAPAERHALIFNTFTALKVGEALALTSDHRPSPLEAQFAERFAGLFQWTYVQAGPALWQVTIAKISDASLGAPCCGHCNG